MLRTCSRLIRNKFNFAVKFNFAEKKDDSLKSGMKTPIMMKTQTPTVKPKFIQPVVQKETPKESQKKGPITMKVAKVEEKITKIEKEEKFKEMKPKREKEELLNFPTVNLKNSYLMKNSIFSKFANKVKNYQLISFKNCYDLNIREMIYKKINLIEKELNLLKEINLRRNSDFKNQNIDLYLNKDNVDNKNNLSNKNNFNEIFQSKSIKELESKLTQLDLNIKDNISFKFNLLNFYTEINIDKAFEYFYDNLSQITLNNFNYSEISQNFSNFLIRLVELDKVIYLSPVLEFIEKNNLKYSLNFEEVFQNFFEHHMIKTFNYENSLLGLRYLFNFIKNNNNLEINLGINLTQVFDNIADHKFNSRKISFENDEVITLLQDYLNLIKNNNNIQIYFKEESIAKIITLFFDNSIHLNQSEGQKVFNLIFQISKQNEDKKFIEILNENLIAYYQYFGFSPRILSGVNLKNTYIKLRKEITNTILSEKELEFIITLFKQNNMTEYIGDILSNWSKFTNIIENESKVFEFLLSDFILNSGLEKDVYYHKKVQEVYKLKNSMKLNQIDELVQITLGYLKDGNKDFAIENFFKELESNMKFARENDKDLLQLYNKVFSPTINNFDEKVKNISIDNNNDDFNIEYEFTLRKLNLIDSIKDNLKNLFTHIKTYESENKFEAQENLIKLTKNIYLPVTNVTSKNILINNLKENLRIFKNLTIEKVREEIKNKKTNEDINNELNKLDDVFNRIKVEIYNDSKKLKLLTIVLEKNIDFVNDLSMIEFDGKGKEELIGFINNKMDRFNNQEQNFLKLVREYFNIKPISFSRTVLLNEESIRNLQDENSLFNYDKLSSYVDEAKNYFRTMQHKFTKRPQLAENLNFLEDIGINLQKVFLQNSNTEDKIVYFENILDNYKNILKNMNKNETSLIAKNISISNHTNLNNTNEMKQLESKLHRLALFSEKVLYYKQITLNRINNHREKNIIKAISKNHNRMMTASKTPFNKFANLINMANLQNNLNYVNNNIYNKTLNALSQVEDNIVNKEEENLYIDNVFEEICKTQGVLSKPEYTNSESTFVTTQTKLTTIKELLNQDYQIFTVKHAIYMMLYGAEHNIPEAIRISEKVCSDFGYIVPSWVEIRVNKYLLKHSKEYASTVRKIGPVNAANVYNRKMDKEDLFDNKGVTSEYDAYKTPTVFAVDYLPFKGLEEVVDLKKFTHMLRSFGGAKI